MEENVAKKEICINPIILLSVAYIVGVVSFLTETVLPISIIFFIFVILLTLKKLLPYKLILVCYTVFALAILNCNFKIKNYDDLSKFIPKEATLTGVVATIPASNNPSKTKFYLNVDTINFDNEKVENLKAKTIVTLYANEESYSKIKIGDKIRITGKLRNPMTAKNPSQFDYSKYLKYHNTFSTFYALNGNFEVVSTPKTLFGKFLQKLNDKRTQILMHHSKYMKPDNLEVLGGIVFGDDAINPPDHIKNSFINSGLLHILAASGMNVSIIFGIWFFIGIRLRLNYRLNILVGAVLVVFYTLMTGMGPSVLRAAMMIEFVLLGKLLNRSADSIALVFLVAFLMLVYNPAMICDVGFQLSFVVTFALMYFCPPILENVKDKFLNFLYGAILIPFVAQLWASPIQMFYFNTYATYSVVANFLIVPFIMIISFLGFLSSILAMVPIDLFAEFVCKMSSIVLNPVVTILISISNFFSNLPHSLLTTIHPNICQIFLYYFSILLLGFSLRNKFLQKKILVFVFILLVFLGTTFIKLPNNNCEIIVFDVGNADSFLIKSPQNKYIMIDTAHGLLDGSVSNFSQADAIMNKYLKDNGIKELEILLLTHFDADHSGGAVDIIKSNRVKRVILNPEEDDSKTSKALFDYLKSNKIKTQNPQNNKIIFEEGDFVLKTFKPNFILNANDNENSTIVLLSYGDFDMLFMADGSVRSFDKVKSDLNISKIEVLKSGHHGANYTINKSMINILRPDAVIISTGINTYGHPHKETLKTILQNGSKIYRTDLDNAIKISASKDKYRIYKYNSQKRSFKVNFQSTNF